MSQKTVIGNAQLIFGTLELIGNTFGQVTDGSIEHMGDEEGIPDADGGFQSYLITNPHYAITVSAIFPKAAALPAIGDPVAIGKIGLIGNILKWKLTYSKGARKIELTINNWLSMGTNPAVAVLNSDVAPVQED